MNKELLQEAINKWPIAKICPRPWRQETLMIYDANNSVVMHLGGMSWGDRVADPYFLTAMAQFIVECVNGHEIEDVRR